MYSMSAFTRGIMDLNELRGKGIGSRLQVSEVDLPEGWRFERRSAKYSVWYDEQGKQYRSSKDVKLALKRQRVNSESETASEYQPSPIKKPQDSR